MAQKYQGRDIDAMKAVANAHKNRSLSEFQKSLEDFKQELISDPIIRAHFTSLYDNLLEQNLLRIVEPFSRVEVAHVAALVGLPVGEIEFKYGF
jgi:26S proteasome regulatory subunit N6